MPQLILCTRPDGLGPCVHLATCQIMTRRLPPGRTAWPRTPVTTRQAEHAGWDLCRRCAPLGRG